MSYLLIPLIIIGVVVALMGVMVFLGRFRNGRYLRPVIAFLSKVPWLRRQFQKVSAAALEKQNPELASAMRKLQRVGTNPDPLRAQQALSQLSATERRAYLEAVEEQGAMPEPVNREQRRRQQRFNQSNPGSRPSGGGSGSGGSRSSKRGKRR